MQDAHSLVLADQTQRLDTFPWSPIVTSPILQNKILYRAVYSLRQIGGIRWYPPIFDQAVRQYKPSILHSHFGDRGWYDLPLARKHNLKQVVTFYGYDLSRLPTLRPVWRKRYQELFTQADLFLCEGDHMAKMLTQLGCPQQKIKVHHLGIEMDKLQFMSRSVDKDGTIKILIAGSFREKKGIPYAIAAVACLRDLYPKLQVTLIGDAGGQKREQAEKKRIIAAIKEHDLGLVVKLMGYQPYNVLIEEMYNHHIFLSPSVTASDGDTEGGAPVTIIEAAATGMPVVSTTHCDIPNIIQHQLSGFLASERDVAELAAALLRFVRNPELLGSMGGAGRAFVEKRHDVRRQAAKLRNYYASLTADQES